MPDDGIAVFEPIDLPIPLPGPGFPVPAASGLYVRRLAVPFARVVEEVRLDVDGRYPQMTASGVIRPVGPGVPVHWIAKLRLAAPNTWKGGIWYKNGNVLALPQTSVVIVATRNIIPANRSLRISFSGGGRPEVTRELTFESSYFRKVEFEFDSVEGANPVTSIATCAHPNRPANMACEKLSIETVFRRAGFEVSRSGDNVMPGPAPGADAVWSDQEMHDAMQAQWSRFANRPQWAMWVFWAALHEMGANLGGIMFDSIGPNHRQGTAIFTESFIGVPPRNDANPAAWVERMRFWTAVHEMGHGFNLAHSWQKQHPPEWGNSWIPLVNDREARSFMNYPDNVAGGQTAFFADFAFRFNDEELLFMRHAPESFVQMGNADWFENHGFGEAAVSPEPTLALEVRVNRERPVFEFLEAAMAELKVTNISGRPLIVDSGILATSHDLTLIIQRDGRPARQWRPFATYCLAEDPIVLAPGQSLYQAVFLGAGTNGWDLAEPGNYLVQACLSFGGEDIVSNPMRLRILPPRGYEEERLAQDVFSDGVGRVLAFDGSRVLGGAVDTLLEVSERLAGRPAAHHAEVAIGLAAGRPSKLLVERDGAPAIQVSSADMREARQRLDSALVANSGQAAETLGHIEYAYYADRYAGMLAGAGEPEAARDTLVTLGKTLTRRGVPGSITDRVTGRLASLPVAAR
ncbi:MAG: hypothetical protein HQL39_06550 [Alphaproteobacteria bacterium]|nr:hypothetical protein [Alphaproteobacteria bacterium]